MVITYYSSQPASTWTDSREKLFAPSPTITTVNASWVFLYENTLSPYTTEAKKASTSSLHCTKAALVMEAVYCGCHRVVVLPIMRSLFCGCISVFLFLAAAAAPHNHHHGHSMTTWSSLKRVQVHIISDCALRALMQILLSGQSEGAWLQLKRWSCWWLVECKWLCFCDGRIIVCNGLENKENINK